MASKNRQIPDEVMNDKLSIIKVKEEMDVGTNRSDVTAAFLKSITGVAPLVGPFIAEAVGMVIPNQKLNRLITFSRVLNDKIKYLEEDVVKQKIKTQEFTDLLEDGMVQASRAMNDKRLDYIASLLKNSITNTDLAHVEEKKLLSLLGELNDAEILTLKFYSLRSDRKREFAELHKDLFTPIRRSIGAPRANIDKGALRDSYRNKLMELGLLEPVYKRPEKDKLPEFDEKTGRIQATAHRVTALGKLLLRYIDQNGADAEVRSSVE